MRKTFVVIFLVLSGIIVRADKIAVIHYKHEAQQAKMQAAQFAGHETEVFSENAIDKLTPRLHEFDAVLIGNCVGYFSPIEWEKYADDWLKYVNDGGVLVVLAACYPSITRELFGRWGKDWGLQVKSCIQHTEDFQKQTRLSFDGGNPLTRFPFETVERFGNIRIWCHYVNISKTWHNFGVCPDGGVPAVYRFQGKGLVMATTASVFSSDLVQTWYWLTMNSLTNNRLRNMQLAFNRFDLSGSFGKQALQLGFNVARGRKITGTLNLKLNDQVLLSEDVVFSGQGDLQFPYTVAQTGTLALEMTLKDENGNAVTIKRVAGIVLPLKLEALWQSYRPEIIMAAPFHILPDPALAAGKTEVYLDGKIFQKIDFGKYPRPSLLDLSGFSVGKHEISARIYDQAGKPIYKTSPVEFEINAKNPELMVDREGFLIQGGKRFFPRGFYAVDVPTDELHLIKEAGYQFIHTNLWTDREQREFPARMRKLEELGLKCIPSGHDWRIGENERKSPALFMLDGIDEPDFHGVAPEGCLKTAIRFREKSDLPVYTVLSQPRSLDGSYFNAADVVAHDSYPLPLQDISAVHRDLKVLVENIAGYGRMPWGVLQCFGYPGNKTGFGVIPSAQEFRNMAYQAVTAGVKGISLYVYRDGKFDLDHHPELKAEAVRFGQELARYEPFLVSSEQQYLTTGVPQLYGRSWKHGGKTLTVLVNANRKAVRYKNMNFQPLEVKISEQ